MAQDIVLELDTLHFIRSLNLTRDEILRASAKALNRTAFEVLEAERREAARAFASASPRGLGLVSGPKAFVFDAAKPTSLVATVKPNPNPPKRGQLLSEHERGGEIFAGKNRLGLSEDYLAVPVGVKRGASGKVPARMAPAAILARSRVRRRKGTFFGTLQAKRDYQRGARAFVAISPRGSGAIVERKGTGSSSRTLTLYALVPKAKLPPIFHWMQTATEAARQWFPRKMAEEIGRMKALTRKI